MGAQPVAEVRAPAVIELLDRCFSEEELASTLGIRDPAALSAAREALYPVLVDVLSRPGKQVRSRLVHHAFAIAHATQPTHLHRTLPAELPFLVELLHAGSLVIDDIEDGAELRRGGPAVHRVHGLPVALNAGNWLYFWPLALVARMQLEADVALAIHTRVSATLLRCHHGQAMDLAIRVSEVAQRDMTSVVELSTATKTGGLLELACGLGATAARATPRVERALATFGREAGVALQMLDDLSSILSPARREKAEEDLQGGRLTWAWAILSERLDPSTFRSLQRMAGAAVKDSTRCAPLLEAMRSHLSVLDRRRARDRVEAAVIALTEEVGPVPEVEVVAQELKALEVAFG